MNKSSETECVIKRMNEASSACCRVCVYLRPEDTMLTTIEEEVLELCTSTVTNTPITSPATGLPNTALSWKMSPAALPVRTHTQTASGKKNSTAYMLHKACYCRVSKVNVQWIDFCRFTSHQLESRAENVQRADEQIEESEQQGKLHNTIQDSHNLSFCVQLCREDKQSAESG